MNISSATLSTTGLHALAHLPGALTPTTIMGTDVRGWAVALIVALVAAIVLETTTKALRITVRRLPAALLVCAVRPQLPQRAWKVMEPKWRSVLATHLESGPKRTRRYLAALTVVAKLAAHDAREQARSAGLLDRRRRSRA